MLHFFLQDVKTCSLHILDFTEVGMPFPLGWIDVYEPVKKKKRPVFSNIQINGNMTYFKRKIKIVNSLVNVTLSNIGILFHFFP